MQCSGQVMIELVQGVQTSLSVDVFRAHELPDLALPDETELISLKFALTVFARTLSRPVTSIALALPTSYEGTSTPDISQGCGPMPVFEPPRRPLASLVHFLTENAEYSVRDAGASSDTSSGDLQTARSCLLLIGYALR